MNFIELVIRYIRINPGFAHFANYCHALRS